MDDKQIWPKQPEQILDLVGEPSITVGQYNYFTFDELSLKTGIPQYYFRRDWNKGRGPLKARKTGTTYLVWDEDFKSYVREGHMSTYIPRPTKRKSDPKEDLAPSERREARRRETRGE